MPYARLGRGHARAGGGPEVKERPINCTDDEVRAILAGTLTELRRGVKPTMTPPHVAPLRIEPWIIGGEQETDEYGYPCWAGFHPDYPGEAKWLTCPYGGVGERLWVREAWRQETFPASGSPPLTHYRADRSGEHAVWTIARMWRSSMHMTHVLSRITLEIVSVNVDTATIKWIVTFRRVLP